MKTIDEDIKTGQFKNVYLLYGTEDYLKQQYKRKLKQALSKPDDTMNVTCREGAHINPLELIDLAETMPFFADYRLIVVEDSGFFESSCDELASYLPELPASTVMLFVESKIDKRSKMYKAASKSGSAIEFGEQKEPLLTRWILGRLKKENKKITQSVLQLFLSKTGTDMNIIDKELEKLLCYTLHKEVICTDQVSNRIFDMVNAIGKRDQKQALSLYYDLLSLKEPPMRILYLIIRQFRILLDLKSMNQKGLDAKTMASKASIPPFAVRRSLDQAASFSEKELRQALNDGAELETAIKTGKMTDQIAAELLIIRYSSRNDR